MNAKRVTVQRTGREGGEGREFAGRCAAVGGEWRVWRRHLVVAAAVVFAAACGGGGGGGGGPDAADGAGPADGGDAAAVDAAGGQHDGLGADTGDAALDGAGGGSDVRADGGADVAQNAAIDFWFVTAGGIVGQGDDTVALNAADEAPAWADVPGFQVDVIAGVRGRADVGELTLRVDGLDVATATVVPAQDPTWDFFATFKGVSFTHGSHEVEVVVDVDLNASKTVDVDLGTCSVTLEPDNQTCIGQDASPLAGFQVTFTVRTDSPNCTQASLAVDTPDGPVTPPDHALDSEGKAVFTVTVFGGEHTDHYSVEVTATVRDETAPGRDGVLGPISYVLDDTPPSITIESPPSQGVGPDDDVDDATPGVQFAVSGTVSSPSEALPAQVEVFVDGTSQGTAPIGADGAFAFDSATVQDTGLHTIEVRAADACGQQGSAALDVPVVVTSGALEVAAPADGDVLLAADDDDPSTEWVYDTAFSVFTDTAVPNTELVVQCREAGASGADAVWFPMGAFALDESAPPEGGLFEVPVALDVAAFGTALTCRAAYPASGAVSDSVDLTVALPGPTLAIVAPAAGALAVSDGLDVQLVARRLEGRSASAWLEGAAGAVTEVATSPPIAQGEASWSVPLVDFDGTPLADGAYVLRASATDDAGNDAADAPGSTASVPVIIDRTAPEVSIAAPGAAVAAADDVSDVLDGVQLDVSVSFSDALSGVVRACLFDGDEPLAPCVTPPSGVGTVVFQAVTLQPGSTALRAEVTDAAGNAAEETLDVTLDADAPRVSIVEPPAGAIVLGNQVDVVVSVTDASGAPIDGADVTLQWAGPSLPPPQSDGPGLYRFAGAPLVEGPNVLRASASADGFSLVGASASRVVTAFAAAPQWSLVAPSEDTVALASTWCAAGGRPCAATVQADTDLPDGVPAVLHVSCDGVSSPDLEAVVRAGQARWFVVLPDGATCVLEASATAAGQTWTDTRTVVVDRTPPVVAGFAKPTAALLPPSSDEDLSTPGMQRGVAVSVAGVPAGATVRVDLLDATGASLGPPLEASVPSDVADGSSLTVSLGVADLPDGIVHLHATVDDAAGNHASPPGSHYVQVFSEVPSIGIVSPAPVDPVPCTAASDCPAGAVCAGGACAVAWGIASPRQVLAELIGTPPALQTVRACTTAPIQGASPCATAGYVQVASATMSAASASLSLASLPDGIHNVILEAELAPGSGQWVSSLDHPDVLKQRRRIFIDTVAPEISAVTSPSDSLDPPGVLNAAEQQGPRAFEFAVEASEDGVATWSAEGTVKATAPVQGGQGSALLAFDADGDKTVSVIVQDAVGNASAPASLSVTVWTEPPSLQFLAPTHSPILAGESLDVVLQTDPGATVALFDAGVPLGQQIAGADGIVTFAGVLTDGTHELVATATDFALNQTMVTTTPQVIVVDTQLPEVVLTAPADGAVLTDADDVEPAKGGFQMNVSFEVTEAATWTVAVAAGCAPDGTGCGEPVELASGNGDPTGPYAGQVEITVPLAAETTYRLELRATDQAGNSATVSHVFTLQLSACSVALSGLPPNGILGTAACDQPGCTEVSVDISAALMGACGTVDEVRLVVDGQVVDTTPPAGGTAMFAQTWSDGFSGTVEVEAYGGGAFVSASGAQPVAVDLSAPTVEFVATTVQGFETPAEGDSVAWGVSDDTDPVAAGLQANLHLTIDDVGPIGTVELVGVQAGGATVSTAISLPLELTTLPGEIDILGVTLTHGFEGDVVATVRDAAGNESTATFHATVDVEPPPAVMLDPIDDLAVNPRRPSVPLTWAAPSDDTQGGGPVAAYDVRYSRTPIESDADFEAACRADELAGAPSLPSPATPGAAESYVVSGPDTRAPDEAGACKFVPRLDGGVWYFAVRAVDDVGNVSPITAASTASTSAVALHVATLQSTSGSTDGLAALHREVSFVGDLNGDGLGDVASGGRDAHGFCIWFGHADSPDGTVSDYTTPDDVGAVHRCYFDDTPTGLGSPVLGAGDLNGDGVADFAAGAGVGAGGFAEELRVYLGNADGSLPDAPTLVIHGMSNSFVYGTIAAAGGNFNGDVRADTGVPLDDIAVASRDDNTVWIVPGSAQWPSADLDLSDAAARAAFGVVGVRLADASGATKFGQALAFAGDILPDDTGAYDELVIGQPGSVAQVHVVRGRPVEGIEFIDLSENFQTVQPDDGTVVRLRPGSAEPTANFGFQVSVGDLDADGIDDIVVNQPFLSFQPPYDGRFYVFRGAALQGREGEVVRIDGAEAASGEWVAPEGVLVHGEYGSLAVVGNFDDDAWVPGGRPDLVHGLFDLFGASYGEVYVRLNHPPASGDAAELVPWRDLVVPAPDWAQAPGTFGIRVAPAGDFNGDGWPDFVVGTKEEGWLLLVY